MGRIDAARVFFLNTLAFSAGILMLTLAVINSFFELWFQTISEIIIACASFLTLLIVKLRKFWLARIYWVNLAALFVVILSINSFNAGLFVETENTMFAIMVISMLVYERYSHIQYWSLLSVLLALKYYKYSFYDDPAGSTLLFTFENTVVIAFLLFVFVMYFIKVLSDVLKELVETTEEVKAHQKELKEHNDILEDRVQTRTEALKKSNEDLEAFAVVASHDLRAPLRAMRHLTNWIQEDLSGSVVYTDRMHDDFTSLKGRIGRMEGMVGALLEYSRLNRVKLLPEEVDLQQLVKETVDLVDPPRGFTVETDLRPQTIHTYRAPLQRILLNLLDNAVRHHDQPEKGSVTVRAQKEGGRIRFSVADNGPGIPDYSRAEALEIFRTLRSKDEKETSGMGLTIVNKIVADFEGQVKLASSGDNGRGLLVTFTLPEFIPKEPTHETGG